jgi:iron complex outermembrane receptor protein
MTPMSLAQGALEEVVVTAQKREQNVAEVPVAVSVLSSEVVQDSFLNNMEDIQQFVPSVSIRQGNTTRNQALTVRGIGTISFSVAAEPSVSTVVDNVVLGRSGQAFADLYDLERVEVLRGPQGTLFGKNASAGVVNITTQRPTDELSGYLDTQIYQDNEYILRGKIAGPINDQLRGSLVVMDASFDGFIQNVFNNETVNGYDKRGLRGMLDYDVNDNTNVLMIFEDYAADNDCCADLEMRPSGRNPDSEAAPNGTGLDLDQRLIDHDFETRTLDDHTAASIQIETGIGEHTLTSITAYRLWDNTEFREGDFTSIAGDSTEPVFGVPFQLHDIGPQTWRQFSQELRLASPVGEAFDYQVGLFYWNIDSERNFTREASCQNNNGQLNAAITNHLQITLDQPNATQADVDAFIADNNITCNANDIVSATGFMDTEFLNYAIFGQGNYRFTDTFSVLFGLRYTSDEVSFNHNRRSNDEFGRRGVGVRPRFSDGNNQFDTNLSGQTDETNVAGKIGAQWDFRDNAMVYATYSQGYKGPAFNVFYNMDDDDINPINAEESDSFELGTKWTWDQGYVAATWFSTEIENFQANDFDTSDGTTITGFTNGGDVETTGVEVDFIYQPTDNLSFSGGFAFIDAESTTGAPLPFAPETRYSLVGRYDMPLASGATVRFNGNYVYSDEKLSGNIGQTDDVPFLLPDYGLLNASVAFISADDRLTVALIGKNLTDEAFVTTFAGDGFRYTAPRDADRYFGMSVRLNY